MRSPSSLYLGYSAHWGITLALKYRYFYKSAPLDDVINAFKCRPLIVAVKLPARAESGFNVPQNAYAR